MSENETTYVSLNDIKDRMLIPLDDDQFDDALNAAGLEASRVIDMFLGAYTTVPLTDNTVPREVAIISADIAASIFKRRMMPEDVELHGSLTPDNSDEIVARGWFGQGIQKLEQYIRSHYVIGTAVTTISNPDVYMNLYNKKLITAKEAREFMTAAAAVVKNVADTLVKSLTNVEAHTIVVEKTTNDTMVQYHTKKQKSFVWVQSDEDDEGYEQQGS
jgi:hypothetical protein